MAARPRHSRKGGNPDLADSQAETSANGNPGN